MKLNPINGLIRLFIIPLIDVTFSVPSSEFITQT